VTVPVWASPPALAEASDAATTPFSPADILPWLSAVTFPATAGSTTLTVLEAIASDSMTMPLPPAVMVPTFETATGQAVAPTDLAALAGVEVLIELAAVVPPGD